MSAPRATNWARFALTTYAWRKSIHMSKAKEEALRRILELCSGKTGEGHFLDEDTAKLFQEIYDQEEKPL
jgi:hypothetical protein